MYRKLLITNSRYPLHFTPLLLSKHLFFMQKKTEAKLYSILFFALTILIFLLSLSAGNPPGVVKSSAPETSFSAERAYQHLLQIAKAPHTVGTKEHEHVKNYIVNACEQMGLQVRMQNLIETDLRSNTLVALNVQNIIAEIKGTRPGKSILISAHYDSQPNTPGATDDGMGVASMLETARAIKALPPMPHDVIFLFTDGEEEGLFGAKAFLKDSLFSNVGLAMNWDFRGNSGTVITYETNPHNGWLIKQYSKAIKYPIANSIGYEIAKRLPNSVDFLYFKKAGVTGFTNGLIGGYANYHSMTDNPGNFDQRSLQQVGDNMLSMTEYVGKLPVLEKTKSADVSFFNVFGYWFIYYPSSLNLYFIIATTILFIFILFTAIRRKIVRPPGFIAGVVALPVTMAISYFLGVFLLKRILNHYPLYTHFYGNNSYNSEWYFLAMTMLSLFIFSMIFQPISRKWEYSSTFPGILLIGIASMWAVYVYAPSASWLLLIPLLFLVAGYGWLINKRKNNDQKKSGNYLINFISVLPAILLFAPLTYFMFLSFGLGKTMPVITIIVVLISALSYPVLSNVFKNYRWLVPILCFAGLFISLLAAHRNAGFDKNHPLQTNIMYRVNTTDSSATWLSNSSTTDKFTKKFFPDKTIDTSVKNTRALIHSAPVLSFAPPTAIISRDTAYPDTRELTLLCNTARENVNDMGIVIDDTTRQSVLKVEIVDAEGMSEQDENTASLNNIIFYGPPKPGFLVKFTLKANAKLGIKLYDQSLGLPEIKGLTEFPPDVIPAPGFSSNLTRVEKHFSL